MRMQFALVRNAIRLVQCHSHSTNLSFKTDTCITLPLCSSAEDSMEVDGEGSLSVLTTKFSQEFTQLYLKMADSARQQSNYAVATRYLKLTEKAVKEVSVLSV